MDDVELDIANRKAVGQGLFDRGRAWVSQVALEPSVGAGARTLGVAFDQNSESCFFGDVVYFLGHFDGIFSYFSHCSFPIVGG